MTSLKEPISNDHSFSGPLFCKSLCETETINYSKKKKKKRKYLLSDRCLAQYSDLIWCFHNDFGRALIHLDDANDLDAFSRVEGLWRHCELREITSEDHCSEVAVVCAEVEETHDTWVIGSDDCPFNNHALVVVFVGIRPGYYGEVIPVQVRTRLKDIVTP